MISKNKIKLIRSLDTKKGRDKTGLFIAESPKVVGDLIEAGFQVDTILDDESDIHLVSMLKHPQGTLGVFHIPQYEDIDILSLPHQELILALDGVQDPGNLGTIIRIADWFGIQHIICSHDTVDCWNPKVVQATMGSIARVQVIYTDLKQYFSRLPITIPIYGTLLDGEDIYEKDLSHHGVIVMGNEGNGISDSIREKVNHRLLIPNYPLGRKTADSLNVAIATAIVCSEFRRRQSCNIQR